MENIDFISFVIGLVAGIILYAIKNFFTVRYYKKELKENSKYIERQMKLTQEGSRQLESDLERLKKENENLRVTVKTLGQKPGRNELRLLNIYDSALRKMSLKAPGFAQGWELSMQEAEKEYEEGEQGITTVIKKVFGPSITHKSETSNAPEED